MKLLLSGPGIPIKATQRSQTPPATAPITECSHFKTHTLKPQLQSPSALHSNPCLPPPPTRPLHPLHHPHCLCQPARHRGRQPDPLPTCAEIITGQHLRRCSLSAPSSPPAPLLQNVQRPVVSASSVRFGCRMLTTQICTGTVRKKNRIPFEAVP
ncbi:hypothetical protein MRB53_007137 [Persea americana]|uniref:Uncharacterized protein n=1 Tax=Persea americana TaxID=3435 RepID=A0ACC2MJ69_PERAE|nr:hypothetical protein MRB53_007137 [Persea americana]